MASLSEIRAANLARNNDFWRQLQQLDGLAENASVGVASEHVDNFTGHEGEVGCSAVARKTDEFEISMPQLTGRDAETVQLLKTLDSVVCAISTLCFPNVHIL